MRQFATPHSCGIEQHECEAEHLGTQGSARHWFQLSCSLQKPDDFRVGKEVGAHGLVWARKVVSIWYEAGWFGTLEVKTEIAHDPHPVASDGGR
jgi:hypothetical protein